MEKTETISQIGDVKSSRTAAARRDQGGGSRWLLSSAATGGKGRTAKMTGITVKGKKKAGRVLAPPSEGRERVRKRTKKLSVSKE